MKIERVAVTVKVELELGDLLKGAEVTSCRGVKKYFDFPRFKIVAFHVDGEHMFLETLNRSGEPIGDIKMEFTSKQWRV